MHTCTQHTSICMLMYTDPKTCNSLYVHNDYRTCYIHTLVIMHNIYGQIYTHVHDMYAHAHACVCMYTHI